MRTIGGGSMPLILSIVAMKNILKQGNRSLKRPVLLAYPWITFILTIIGRKMDRLTLNIGDNCRIIKLGFKAIWREEHYKDERTYFTRISSTLS